MKGPGYNRAKYMMTGKIISEYAVKNNLTKREAVAVLLMDDFFDKAKTAVKNAMGNVR